jgi:hypothetical protein
MPRRKNPGVTLVMFLLLLAAGWAAYHYLYVERVFDSKGGQEPRADHHENVRRAIEEAMGEDSCFLRITGLAWRQQEFRWRVDVDVQDGCRDRAKSIAQRVHDVVKNASGGNEANIFVYAVGQEVGRLVP